MVHPARVKSRALNGVPHLPFQEFTAQSLEALLNVLKRAKIPNSEIEVSTSDESQHTACSKPLVHILVTITKQADAGELRDLAALYQYCPECHQGVRVL